ncbi:hypothetical protein OJF2_15420 [Aquisphaera giovannonii]|uniref:Uncharacterized protein n=1 Tax=Aquisphaera giovannonii TaxID=406548 RepID=A0A5B9VXD8_9BACT|nr:hypothetical protein [Aquisphaera giovannonii]QEH33046.1 hypothetical protein OJF2_15420 [Aquisphaera giovannonii]
MKAEASRRNWIRKGAWAVLAALVPASESPAIADGDRAQGQAFSPIAAASPSDPGAAASGSGRRTTVPPPRPFSEVKRRGLLGRTDDARRSAPIPPPRIFVADKPAVTASASVSPPEVPAPAPADAPAPAPAVAPAPATAAAAVPALAEAPAPAPPAAPPVETQPVLAASPMADPIEVGPSAAERPRELEAALKSLGARSTSPSDSGPAPDSAAAKLDEPVGEPARPVPSSIDQSPAPSPAADDASPAATPAPALAVPELDARPAIEPAAEAKPEPEHVEAKPAVDAKPAPVPAEAPAAPAAASEPAGQQTPKPSPAPVPARAVAASAATSTGPGPDAPTSPAGAATPADAAAALVLKQPDAAKTADDEVEKAACTTCGSHHGISDGHVFTGCANGKCIPGRPPCNPPANECDTIVGAFCQRLYECLCCPDPCYKPVWEPAANASFFADYARPRTVTRLRYDNLEAMSRPDRNQFMMNQVNPRGRGVFNPMARLQQVSVYQEAAGERGSLFVEYPYRQLNSNWAPTQAGFGDVNFGIKSLWFDCEMLQVAFQLRTYMPSGNFQDNLGTGQFAIDPSILTSLKLGPTTFFQGQFGNWTPLGGPSSATLNIPARMPGTGALTSINGGKQAGGIFYWFMSLNQVLWYYTPDSPLTATLEMDGWSFENGGYTTAVRPKIGSGGTGALTRYGRADGGGVSYFNIGPGLRQSICNRVDFGGAITWATDTAHWAQPWFRFEVRFLF